MANRSLKKRAYEFKLTRVREAGASSKVDSPELATEFWKSTIENADWYQESKEHLVTLFLNTRYSLNGFNLVSMGSLNETTAHPREIFAPVLCAGAFAFILMHNHPSGDPSPSQADRNLTRRITEGASIFEIKFLDHVIIGGSEEPYFSFREMGML
ncbi:MAG: DNA repair protein RadC [Verrucomicrobiales bacterium]|jgi:DNA repair protein RadC